ncbi:DNA damage response protein DdrC [Deinococcus radiomollis]|uniref:DNA damage response protein DdrC n=1 Tax=Deinococcus radiomollis TaxID=468916 RepID=UPI0038914FAF
MKVTPQSIRVGTQLLPAQGGFLLASRALELLGLAFPVDWAEYARAQGLTSPEKDFGIGPEPTLSLPEFVRLGFEAQTPQARRWQKSAHKLLARMLAGDVRLSAEIAEANPDPQAGRWLHARLENQNARKLLMSTVARHGGSAEVYGQLGSISNASVLGMDSATLRRERGVKSTRDGLNTEELLRLSYLESATASAIEGRGAHGNAAILSIHRSLAAQERRTWQSQPRQNQPWQNEPRPIGAAGRPVVAGSGNTGSPQQAG